jgi:hypothetical protein
MYNIAIIGAGQLGSRHLQGLTKANIDMSIYVVDLSPDALSIAHDRYKEMPSNQKIRNIDFFANMDLLPPKIDLAIISTNSKMRAEVTAQLVTKPRNVKNIIFEKFLFPAVNDYFAVGELLKSNKISSWVNCPRRLQPFYKELRTLLQETTQATMEVSGTNWGLCCNAIHFIDLFDYLFNKNQFLLNTSGLNRKILASKRSGYIEFTGTLEGNYDANYRFVLISKKIDGCGIDYIKITTNKFSIDIDETAKKVSVLDTDSKNKLDQTIEYLYQSQLTGQAVEQIVTTNTSDLIDYYDSTHLHLQILYPLLDFYNHISNKNAYICPIT